MSMHALTCLSNNSDKVEVKMFSQKWNRSLLTTVATKQIEPKWLKNIITLLRSKFLQKGRLENDLKRRIFPGN